MALSKSSHLLLPLATPMTWTSTQTATAFAIPAANAVPLPPPLARPSSAKTLAVLDISSDEDKEDAELESGDEEVFGRPAQNRAEKDAISKTAESKKAEGKGNKTTQRGDEDAAKKRFHGMFSFRSTWASRAPLFGFQKIMFTDTEGFFTPSRPKPLWWRQNGLQSLPRA